MTEPPTSAEIIANAEASEDRGLAVKPETIDAVVELGRLALNLGRVDRITFHPDGTTPESDTDHTVMLGIVACALADKWFFGLRNGLIAQYALVHDLVEAYAGDTPTLRELGTAGRAAKKARETAALDRITSEFRGVLPWLPFMISTYEDEATPEARFVRMLDKVLPKITHLLNGASTIAAEGMTRTELVARYEAQGRELDRYAAEFPEVEELRQALVERVLARMDGEQ